MEIRIKVQGWQCKKMLELAELQGISPTKLIHNLLAIAAQSAQENKDVETSKSVSDNKRNHKV